jgi:tRNA pseudouridine38-40 synthase
MRNLKITLEYDGTNYCGWQIQRRNRRKVSIQGTVEKTLRKILQEKIHLIASGRTDAGVHARAQVANFKTSSVIPLDKLQYALNGLLPNDISITGIREARSDFHSRFDAKSKAYRYTILNRRQPSAFLRTAAYFYPYPLDIKLMRDEAGVLLGRHDFRSFKASDEIERNSIRTIKKIRIAKDKDLISIDIEADGFLYNMARAIAGTLLEIGRGRFHKGSLKKILKSCNRGLAGPTLPAYGLCLLKVKY